MNAAPTQFGEVVAAPAPVPVAPSPGPLIDQATTSEVSVKVVDAMLAGGTGSTIAVLFAVVAVALAALVFVFRRSEQQVTARLEEAQRDNEDLQNLQKKLDALETRYDAECRECEAKSLLRQQEASRQVERERERADSISTAAQIELRAAVERHSAELAALRDKAEAQLFRVEAERKAQAQEFSASVESMHQATLSEYRILVQNVTHSLESVRQAMLSTRDTVARSTGSSFGFSSNVAGAAPCAPQTPEQQRSEPS